MIRTKMPGTATLRRAWACCALLALAAALAACRSYVFLPVDVAYEKLSPPYVVSIVNDTGAPLEVLPSSTGTRAGYAGVRVPAGGSFKAILQLRSVSVGAGSSVAGAQVLDNPYFEHAPPDKAEMRLKQGDPHSLLIAIHDPSWFSEYQKSEAAPIELVIPLRRFSRAPLFPQGPRGGP